MFWACYANFCTSSSPSTPFSSPTHNDIVGGRPIYLISLTIYIFSSLSSFSTNFTSHEHAKRSRLGVSPVSVVRPLVMFGRLKGRDGYLMFSQGWVRCILENRKISLLDVSGWHGSVLDNSLYLLLWGSWQVWWKFKRWNRRSASR